MEAFLLAPSFLAILAYFFATHTGHKLIELKANFPWFGRIGPYISAGASLSFLLLLLYWIYVGGIYKINPFLNLCFNMAHFLSGALLSVLHFRIQKKCQNERLS